ncbi:hypothetical protein BDV59DRAFT_197743 [Aspergillus ambiguus]|uniref:3-hydroxyacyl-CoA dehydrogenase family protein n=1 Tax=Aspergillus ambiguus TaxID=176160 RepID=UPI003CCCDB93
MSHRPIAVVGGGVLGRRLCMMWAAAGHNVNLHDKKPLVVQDAMNYIEEAITEQMDRLGRKTHGTVRPIQDLEHAVQDAWMVIEAIPEVLEPKIKVFEELDRLCRPDCILATNSSSYRSREIAERVVNKYRACNTHYYMPPEKNYVEVMTCGETDQALIEFLMQQATEAGFISIHAKVESTGFVFNRVWAAIKRECLHAMADGVGTAEEIDLMFKGWFHADVGPFKMMDHPQYEFYMMEYNHNRNQRVQKTPRHARRAASRGWRHEPYARSRSNRQRAHFPRYPQSEGPSHDMDMEIEAMNQPGMTPVPSSQRPRSHAAVLEYAAPRIESPSFAIEHEEPASACTSRVEQLSHEMHDHRPSLQSLGTIIEQLTGMAHSIGDGSMLSRPVSGNTNATGEHGAGHSWVDTAITVIRQGYEDEINHRRMVRTVLLLISEMQTTRNHLLSRSPYYEATRVVDTMMEQHSQDLGGRAFLESELEATFHRLHGN